MAGFVDVLFAVLGLSGFLIFLGMAFLSIIGGGGAHDVGSSHHGGMGDVGPSHHAGAGDAGTEASGHVAHGNAPLIVISVQSVVAFFTGFGLSGAACRYQFALPVPVALAVAIGAGLLLMILSSRLALLMSRFSPPSGNVLLAARGALGQVRLPVPGNGEHGYGEVEVVVNGALKTLPAVSTGAPIAKNSRVTVIDVRPDGTLLVDPFVAPQLEEVRSRS